jgi:tRNA (guanine-N7-)-methyltransferase
MAIAHPTSAFIGFDITFKRVVTSAERAKMTGLINTLSVYSDARAIEEIFGAESLDGVVAFFPDPWIKKKSQLKKRLFSDEFCQVLLTTLKPGGFFWFKSDSYDYFSHVEKSARIAGFSDHRADSGITTEKYSSTFEKLFFHKNLPCYEQIWKKPDPAPL